MGNRLTEAKRALCRPGDVLIETHPLRFIVHPPVENPDPQLSFEQALEKLEGIVEAMESGEVPLAELLAKFEQGTQLLKVCETRLKDAEIKIELLKKQKDGVVFTKLEIMREA